MLAPIRNSIRMQLADQNMIFARMMIANYLWKNGTIHVNMRPFYILNPLRMNVWSKHGHAEKDMIMNMMVGLIIFFIFQREHWCIIHCYGVNQTLFILRELPILRGSSKGNGRILIMDRHIHSRHRRHCLIVGFLSFILICCVIMAIVYFAVRFVIVKQFTAKWANGFVYF